MSAPEILTIEQLFAAAQNSMAVTRIREWCVKTAAAATVGESEDVFQVRMGLVDEVRRMLPKETS